MDIQKIARKQINPAPYNPRLDLQPGDKEYDKHDLQLFLPAGYRNVLRVPQFHVPPKRKTSRPKL